ncbi:MAG: hypothetical protein ACFFE4_11820 [Candidatus Thorarchaeota archaeon]
MKLGVASIHYRGYILIRLKIIGTQWQVVEKLKNLKPSNPNEDWEITYATPIYGGWDLIAECSFGNLEDLEKIVSYCRTEEELSNFIETTTTLISIKKNYSR